MGLLASLALAVCVPQRDPAITLSADKPAPAGGAPITVTPLLTPTVFTSTFRDCLDELKISAPDLDRPAGLIMRQVSLQGMGLSTQELIRDITVNNHGAVRQAEWWFFPETPGLMYTLNGRFEPETCSTWTIPPDLVDQLEAALLQPDYLALRVSDFQSRTACMDYGGFVLISGSWLTRQELYIIECPLENAVISEIMGMLGSAYSYKTSP